jgi:phage-related protein
MVAKAKNMGSQFLSSVTSFFTQLPGKIQNFLTQAVTKVATWGTNMVTKAKEGMSKVVTSVTTTLKELPSKVLSVGKDLVTGLWNGINDKLAWLKQKIASFTESVLSSIKAFFGVKSPSRETAWIGDMLDQGLAKGVLANADDPIKAMEKVSGSVLDAATADLDGLKLERSLQHTFTTPTTSAASSAEALLVKLDGIYERLGRLQIVMDSGALVGETIDKIDSALGTRQLLSARGV